LSNASGYALAGTLGAILPATGEAFKKADELGIDLQGVLDKKITPTAEQMQLLAENNISANNPVFAGFEIHNLFEFFMVFVALTGIASVILFAITPKLKKMMHGVK
jgi:POT family proton-dependent oligopeptide transporter